MGKPDFAGDLRSNTSPPPSSSPKRAWVGKRRDMAEDRYKVIDGSQSSHCCFEATVVDTTQPFMIGDEHYGGLFVSVCECLDRQDAEKIAAALNGTSPTD